MTTTRKTFPVPATKLVTWNGYYIYKNKKVKIYFYLLPNQEFDTEQFYEVYERIGTNGLNKMTVLGEHIIHPQSTQNHLPRAYYKLPRAYYKPFS
jgi:hypothetical protein